MPKKMTYQLQQLFKTIATLVKDEEHIAYQLQWLESIVENDAKHEEKTKDYIASQDLVIEDLKGNFASVELAFQVEEKWRIELEAKVAEQQAELTKLADTLSNARARHRAIVADLKGTGEDLGAKNPKKPVVPKKRGRPAKGKDVKDGK